ncbi:enoyl-[acyl-carrier-protein] reductase FabK [Serpentinicella alkaliphila]|uniref:Probable nitronate monooxygenase n=1 Tax=Serpentinicella alkaliphila TaxID=1734049 RepID=A0A4R2TSE5_9FIRM|nr:enoyl-[acyl-carrier-protein] reductase FabK [Serpentinicella alkaliphila]QUH26250.1 enoyl-[acyl-carrier-protein] reductase FabK [Serpentinicella alkaliphila]TCQ05826.1 enoyl-[acyl-carrier protein] reductase II [Serpentinicella alkaliphila]
MFHTELCDILNIKYPIIQGGMAWVATAELAAAVSNAGGLGIIAGGNAPADILEREIKKAKKLTNKPFGVNVMLLSPFIEDVMKVVYKEEVPVISTGAGNPGKYMGELKKLGTKVLPVVPSIALAKRMESLGADAIIVEGTEAGGHIGELTTMALVPQIIDSVSIPVIAAGGIADGRGFLAALSLGAKGVQIGTRFICSNECEVHENYKLAIIKAKDRDAIVTARSTGHPVRVLKNKFSKELLKLEKEGHDPEALYSLGTGKLRLAAVEGDMENGSVMIGQIAGMVKNIKSCEEIINEILEDAKSQLSLMKELV